MSALLRNFLYLDERLTSMYLAQLEGGVYDEEEQSHTDSRERKGGASATVGGSGLGAGAQFGRGSAGENKTTRTVRQTPEAAYRRLEKLLEEEGEVQWLEAFDDAIWQDLKRSELVAVESVMKVPSLYKATELAASAGPMVDLMRMMGQEIDSESERDMKKNMPDVVVSAPAVILTPLAIYR